jgi:hypothetical protein
MGRQNFALPPRHSTQTRIVDAARGFYGKRRNHRARRINQVYLLFRAQLLNLDFGPGPESLEVALFREQDIPWDDLAFRTVEATLKAYYSDRRGGGFGFHIGDIGPAQPRPD